MGTDNTSGTAPAPSALDPVGEATLELFAESEEYNRFLLSRLRALAPPRGRVLEVGCGIGNISRLLLEEPDVTAVHAIDLDPRYVRRVTSTIGDPRLTASVSSLEEFNPPRPEAADGIYDSIVCSNVLEHIEDDVGAVRNFARLLRPGGCALILVPAHPWLFSELDRNLSHYRRYTLRGLSGLARGAGLEFVRGRYFNPLGVPGWWFNGKVLRRATLPAGQLKLYARVLIPLSAILDRLNPLPLGISVLGVMKKS